MKLLYLCLIFCFMATTGGLQNEQNQNTVNAEADTENDPDVDVVENPTGFDRFVAYKKHPICNELTWGSVLTDEEILDRIESMIPEFQTKGLVPAIPVFQLDTYRGLPLTDCKVQNNGQLTFQVDVPVKAKNQDYQLFNFPKGSFSFEADDGICHFEYPTKGIVEASAGDTIIPLSEKEWENCVKTSICQVPTAQDVDMGDLVCLQAVFKGKVGRELAPFCKFHCQPHPIKNRRQEISESFFLSWILK